MVWLQARLKKERKEGIKPGTEGSFQSRGLTFKKLGWTTFCKLWSLRQMRSSYISNLWVSAVFER